MKPPTAKPPTIAELRIQLDYANSRIRDLDETVIEARKGADEQRAELRTVRDERDRLRKSNDVFVERAMSDRAENARLSGKLEMLRELGTIPTIETRDEGIRIHNHIDYDNARR